MKLTQKNFIKLYDEMNVKLFSGKLPSHIGLKISEAPGKRNPLGCFWSLSNRDRAWITLYKKSIDCSIRKWEDVLLHEMIHAYLWTKHVRPLFNGKTLVSAELFSERDKLTGHTDEFWRLHNLKWRKWYRPA